MRINNAIRDHGQLTGLTDDDHLLYTLDATFDTHVNLTTNVHGSTLTPVAGRIPQFTGAGLLQETNYVGITERQASQTIADITATAISFDTEVLDTNAMIDIAGAPTRLTIPATGLYIVCAHVVVYAFLAAGYINGSIRLNGATPLAYDWQFVAMSDYVGLQWSFIKNLSATDYLEMVLYQATGNTCATSNGVGQRAQISAKILKPI